MLLQIKNFKKFLNILKNISITYDDGTDSYYIKTRSNIVIESDKNIITVTKGDIVQIGKFIHLNPDIKTKEKYKEIENGRL